ncbi:septal ring lytic transglycosylase RlpA family protein [Variovorax ginsengisoli]|uniref:Endolytic peptidoglycan transglycosylase RlpA n=1 Tax=Variovorax ginsengisoli TaxID=363844 RepID=A0ABT9S7C7_9BURK|nr:septal ring lytic transglycosylase RlpA family protein [Variovorax ginsengisoli]MDP9900261.1 rare lipoprotein A [Variovorax ginsengisoli]
MSPLRCSGPQRSERLLLACAALAILAGCASGPRGGRDGAPANPPAGLSQVPDAEPRVEPIRSGGTSKPYTVLGRSYVPITDDRPWRETGLASWYGTQFHSQSTASGEPYDMYAMTAAHKTLPLPSYVRVRNPANGREVIVRVNDRGPFHDDRVIDLSYAAALKLDLLRGVAPVEIERITNEDIRTGAWRREGGTAYAAASPSATQVAQAPQSVAVPLAMTTPVVSAPRAQVTELPPLSSLPPSASPSVASPTDTSVAGPYVPPASSGDSTAAAPGFWVQLGAFSQRDSAVNFQRQVARSLPAIAPTLNVFSERGTHRLQTGPYGSRDTARQTAEQIRSTLALAPMIVERR